MRDRGANYPSGSSAAPRAGPLRSVATSLPTACSRRCPSGGCTSGRFDPRRLVAGARATGTSGITIGPADAMLEFVRLARFDGVLPCSDDAGEVVRVNSVRGAPSPQFFERPAEVLEDLAVDVFDAAVGVMTAIRPGIVSTIRRKASSPAPKPPCLPAHLDSRPSVSP